MSARQTFYDIHHLVTLRIIDNRDGLDLFASLGQPFTHFQVDSLPGKPDISLELGEFEPHFDASYLVDHKYHVRRNYLYCQDHWRSFRWKVEIEGIETGPTTIRLALRGGGLRRALVPGLFANMLLTRQLIGRHLRARGCALIHAAAAVRQGRAVVAFGRGGSYKTTVLMSLLQASSDWRIMGDDGVIIKDDQALSFPTYPALFDYRLKHMSTEHLNLFDRFGYLLGSLRPGTIGERYASTAGVAALVEMKAGHFDHVTIQEVPVLRNITAMLQGMRVEEHNSVNMGFNDIYPQYVEAYSYIFPENALKTVAAPQEEDCSALVGVSSYQVCLPASPDQSDLDAVIRLMNEIVFN